MADSKKKYRGGLKSYVNGMTGKGPFRYEPGARRDNILFVSVDMLPRSFYLPLPGSLQPRTANLDRLKDNHVFFQSAFCSSPLCAPSRASYLSGRYSYITGNSERAHDGQLVHLRDEDILFPEYLKASGYHLRHVGKSHVGTHKFMDMFGENDSPWDRWSPPWNDDDRYVEFLKARGLDRLSFQRGIWGRDPAGTGKGNFYGGWLAPQRGRPFPREATYTAYLVDRAIGALETRQDRDRPFYLQLDFFGPHQPFAIPSGLEERERELRRQIRLPDSYRRIQEAGFQAPWPEPRVYRMYRKSWGLQDPDTLTDYMVANLLQFELIDEQLGRLLGYLKEQRLYEDTWILFIADHGEMNGEWGLIDKGAFLNPAVIQVPILIKPPAGHPLADRRIRVDSPVSLLDLAPTILEIAGIRTEERLDGISLLEAIAGGKRAEDKPILFDIWAHVVPNPCIGTVFAAADGRTYLFTFNAADDLDELYALGPEEPLINRAGDPGFGRVLAEALERMQLILEGDLRWQGYSDYFSLKHAERLGRPRGDRQRFFGRQ